MGGGCRRVGMPRAGTGCAAVVAEGRWRGTSRRLVEGARPPPKPKRKPAPASLRAPAAPLGIRSGDLGGLDLLGIAKHVAAAPDGLDIIVPAASQAQFLAKLADEDVDDLQLGLVHPAIEVVEEHFL